MLEQNKMIAIFEIAIMKNLDIILGYSYYCSGFNICLRGKQTRPSYISYCQNIVRLIVSGMRISDR